MTVKYRWGWQKHEEKTAPRPVAACDATRGFLNVAVFA
jgi:hypothetical protein